METKKIVAILGSFLSIVVVPLILLSSGMMGCYQKKIDAAPNTESAKDWQIRLAGICRHTGRQELAAQMYKKFIDRYAKEARRPAAMWARGDCLKELGRDAEAKEAFRALVNAYPDSTEGKDADGLLTSYYKDYQR